MTNWIPPAAIFIFGACIIPFLTGKAKQVYLLLLPVLAFINLLNMPEGTDWVFNFLGYEVIFGKVDKLSKVFGYIFVIMAFGGALFSLHLKEQQESVAGFLYAGGSLGVVFAGDFLSLFIFWEIMSVSSTYIVWSRRTKAAQDAGLRYILVHLLGGLFLLFGIIINASNSGSIEFGFIELNGLASYLILIGFAVNAAIPPLSAWLSDSYPESTVTGAVFLSAFTTKTAVYVLCRAFPGAEILIWAGALMTIYGIIYAILENDMRRVLAYSIINQVGFMVAGIGIGTELSINGTASHAFAHILYKALLFMSAGAVLYRTGKSKCTDLGGLYKTMPVTLIFCLVGAASISAFPLTGGFISKSMIISASGHEKMTVIWLLLNLASAGVFLHAGIKFPYFVFFAKDSGLRPKEPPLNMLLAMGFFAFLCIFIGVFPGVLYRILPYPVEFVPYTASHVINQLQILLFSALAFFTLLKFLQRTETISLDTDWFYRKGSRAFLWFVDTPMSRFGHQMRKIFFDYILDSLIWFSRNPLAVLKMAADTMFLLVSGPDQRIEIKKRIEKEKEIYPGDIIKHWPIGSTVLYLTFFLLTCLLVYYL